MEALDMKLKTASPEHKPLANIIAIELETHI